MTDYIVHLPGNTPEDIVINEQSPKLEIYSIIVCDEKCEPVTIYNFKSREASSDYLQDNNLRFFDLELNYDCLLAAETKDTIAIQQGMQYVSTLCTRIVWYCKPWWIK